MSAIKTYTGIIMDPIKPEEKLICIEDIAHALSLLCRANGHFKTFYSVAQHSINCMREAAARGYSKRQQLACLLHDGSEAYLADIIRPVKAELPKYKEIEEPLQELIWNKWLNEPLTEQEKVQVFEIDDAILAYEFIELMNTQIVNPIPEILTKPEYAFAGFEKTEQEFLSAFRKLTSEERNTFAVIRS